MQLYAPSWHWGLQAHLFWECRFFYWHTPVGDASWGALNFISCSLQSANLHAGGKTCQEEVDSHTAEGWVPTCWTAGSSDRQNYFASFSTQWAQSCRIFNRSLPPETGVFFGVFQIFPQTAGLFQFLCITRKSHWLTSQYFHGHHVFGMEQLMLLFMNKTGCSLFIIVVTTRSPSVQVKKLMLKTQLCINTLC